MHAAQKCNSKVLRCYILDKSIVISFEYLRNLYIEESCYKFIIELQNLIKYLEIFFQFHNKEFIENEQKKSVIFIIVIVILFKN